MIHPHVYIQYKGTDICFDLYCDCGNASHYDGYFAYAVKCTNCKKIWELPTEVEIKPDLGNKYHEPVETE